MSGNRLRLEVLEDRWNLSPLDLSAAVAPAPDSAHLQLEQVVMNYAKVEISDAPQKDGTLDAPPEGSFSTVASAEHDIERTGAEQKVNYDKLVLEIWTNGEVPTQNFHFVARANKANPN